MLLIIISSVILFILFIVIIFIAYQQWSSPMQKLKTFRPMSIPVPISTPIPIKSQRIVKDISGNIINIISKETKSETETIKIAPIPQTTLTPPALIPPIPLNFQQSLPSKQSLLFKQPLIPIISAPPALIPPMPPALIPPTLLTLPTLVPPTPPTLVPPTPPTPPAIIPPTTPKPPTALNFQQSLPSKQSMVPKEPDLITSFVEPNQ
jgi:hypothetical protein